MIAKTIAKVLVQKRKGQSAFVSSKVVLLPSDNGLNPEDAGLGNFWLSPDGKFYLPGGDHSEWARKRITEENKSPRKSYEYAQELIDKGWIRVSIERETWRATFLNGRNPTAKQSTAIQEYMEQHDGHEFIFTGALDSKMF